MSRDEDAAHPLLSASGFGLSLAAATWLLPLDSPFLDDPLMLVVVGAAGAVAGRMLLYAMGRSTVALVSSSLILACFAALAVRMDRGTWSGLPWPIIPIAALAAASWASRSGGRRPQPPHRWDDPTRFMSPSEQRRAVAGRFTSTGSSTGPPMRVTDLLAGRWAVLGGQPLPDADQGGQSRVHLALDTRSPGLRVVAKLPSYEQPEQSAARLAGEADLLRACRRSPYVVTMLDSGLDPDSGSFYVVLVHHRRGSLARLLSTAHWLRLSRAIAIASDVLRGVVDLQEHCGQSIVHGDLNPRNLLLSDDPLTVARPAMVICDLGIARRVVGRADQATTVPFGHGYSHWYGAPELLRGPAAPGLEVDVYGAAAVLYELVTGQPPLKRESIRLGQGFAALVNAGVRPMSAGLVNPDLPGDLVDLLDLCLTPWADERPGIAADVLDRLRRIAGGLDDLAIPFGDLQRWDGPTGLWSA